MTNENNLSDAAPPLISVGMPIRNEERFLRAALDALTRQTGVKLEIIISDNASTDATPAICQEYCARFPWISYHRFEENAGAAANFTYVLEQARGKYFMWASGHDLWQENYLKECSSMLERFPEAVLAAGETLWIDANDAPHARSSGWNDTRGASRVGRYFTVFWGNMNPIIALIRSAELKAVGIANMAGGDLAMLLALALRGDFIHTCHTSWKRREFRDEASYAQKLKRYGGKEFALGGGFLARVFPLARLPLRIIGDVCRAELGFGSKLQLLLILFPSLLVKYFADRARHTQAGN